MGENELFKSYGKSNGRLDSTLSLSVPPCFLYIKSISPHGVHVSSV